MQDVNEDSQPDPRHPWWLPTIGTAIWLGVVAWAAWITIHNAQVAPVDPHRTGFLDADMKSVSGWLPSLPHIASGFICLPSLVEASRLHPFLRQHLVRCRLGAVNGKQYRRRPHAALLGNSQRRSLLRTKLRRRT